MSLLSAKIDREHKEELLLLVKEIRDKNIQIVLPNHALTVSGITQLKDESFDYDQSVRFTAPVQTLTLSTIGTMNGSVIDLVENLVRSIINGWLSGYQQT